MIILLLACKPPADDVVIDDPPSAPLEGDDIFGIPLELPDDIRVTDLGQIPTVDGITAPLRVDIDADTVAFYPVAHNADQRVLALVYAEDPDGRVWVDVDRETDAGPAETQLTGGYDGLYDSPNRTFTARGRNTTLFPNNPDVDLVPGEWIFQYGVFNGTGQPLSEPVDFAVVERFRPLSDDNTLDVMLHFSGSGGIDASGAAEDGSVERLLGRIEDFLAPQGITLGEIQFRDAPQVDAVVNMTDNCGLGRDANNTLGSLESDPGYVNVVFVDSFSCGGVSQPFIAGISGGVPGLPYSRTSGVFIGTSLVDQFPNEWANVGVHELGHFLGLFHTQELGTSWTDQLDDTPAAGAFTNLMYPTPDIATSITDDQGWVLRRSIWLGP